jgi:SAM-dependent methyltransferase
MRDVRHANSLLAKLQERFDARKPRRFMPVYESFLARRRHEALRLVEIGVQSGNSLRMWRAYFPTARLYGVDIDPHCGNRLRGLARTEVFTFDQSDAEQLKEFTRVTGGRFDVVIDDGGHHMNEQIRSFEVLFGCLAGGGIYFIEDLGTSYVRERGGGGIGAPGTTVAMLKPLVDSVTHAETMEATARSLGHTQAVTDRARNDLRRDVAAIHFYPSLAVIEKTE